MCESLIRSFPLSNLSKLLMVAHLSRATWAIHSRSLISSEQPERFAQSRSFFLSDLSELLTVAHLIWAKWANEPIPSPVLTDDSSVPHIATTSSSIPYVATTSSSLTLCCCLQPYHLLLCVATTSLYITLGCYNLILYNSICYNLVLYSLRC